MTAYEFANKYAGQIADVNISGSLYRVRVIGYIRENGVFVGVEFLDRGGYWEADESRTLISLVPRSTIANKCGWLLPEEYKDLFKDEIERKQTLYPNRCKTCSSPCRKCASYIFCSNTKCKTRKMVEYKKIKRSKYIQCPRCLTEGVYTITDQRKGVCKLSCDNGHITLGFKLKVGDIVRASVRKRKSSIPVDYMLEECVGGYRWKQIKPA